MYACVYNNRKECTECNICQPKPERDCMAVAKEAMEEAGNG